MNLVEKYNLKVGDKISYDMEDIRYDGNKIIGIIGEISNSNIYIWNNTHDGDMGALDPSIKGYLYSWCVPIIESTIANIKKDINVRELNVRELNADIIKKEIKNKIN